MLDYLALANLKKHGFSIIVFTLAVICLVFSIFFGFKSHTYFVNNTYGTITAVDSCQRVEISTWDTHMTGTIDVQFHKPYSYDNSSLINLTITTPIACHRGGACCVDWVGAEILFKVNCTNSTCVVKDLSDAAFYWTVGSLCLSAISGGVALISGIILGRLRWNTCSGTTMNKKNNPSDYIPLEVVSETKGESAEQKRLTEVD